jgi:hypothetical protein
VLKLEKYLVDLTIRQGVLIVPALALLGLLITLAFRPYQPENGGNPTENGAKQPPPQPARGGRGRTRPGRGGVAEIAEVAETGEGGLEQLPLSVEGMRSADRRAVPLALLGAYSV